MGSSEWNEAHWGGVGDEDEDSMSKVKSLKETTLNREGRNKEESLAACTDQEDKKTNLAGMECVQPMQWSDEQSVKQVN